MYNATVYCYQTDLSQLQGAIYTELSHDIQSSSIRHMYPKQMRSLLGRKRETREKGKHHVFILYPLTQFRVFHRTK